MAYLSSPPESWELEQERFLNSVVPTLPYGRRIAVLLTVGMVAAIEISNRLSINVFLPDMQGNVGASSDEISWVIILSVAGGPSRRPALSGKSPDGRGRPALPGPRRV